MSMFLDKLNSEFNNSGHEKKKPLGLKNEGETFKKFLSEKLDENGKNINKAEKGSNSAIPDFLRLSKTPGRYKDLQKDFTYDQGLSMFRQLTAKDFDPAKLPIPELVALGMSNIMASLSTMEN
jgi:hypothetical protein